MAGQAFRGKLAALVLGLVALGSGFGAILLEGPVDEPVAATSLEPCPPPEAEPDLPRDPEAPEQPPCPVPS